MKQRVYAKCCILYEKRTDCLVIEIHSGQCPHHGKPSQVAIAFMKHQQKNFPGTIDPECQILQRYHSGAVGKHSSQDPQYIIQKSDPQPQQKGMCQKNILTH